MALIKIYDLKPEMILAADLKSPQGRLLLPKGTVLNKEHLRACAMWEIYEAEITNLSSENLGDGNRPIEIDQEIIEASETLADSRFHLANREHPVMQRLIRLFVTRVSRRMVQHGIESAPQEKKLPVADRDLGGSPPASFQKLQMTDLEIADSKLTSLPGGLCPVHRFW